jgi:hypothetical protein
MVAEKVTTTTSKSAKKPRKSLFQDAITVEIPMNVTADLGIAIRQTRKKRIAGILAQFPFLKTKDVILETKEEAEEGKEGDDDKKEVDANLPQRHQYASVLDYLEAKYVRGVVLQEEGDEGTAGAEEEDEKAGSVYDSDGSFLDDTLLQRDVAEQVISQATHTKLELEEEDADFFVNVGTLEVEDHDLMDYDPVQEEKLLKKRKLEGMKKMVAKKTAPKKAKTEGPTAKPAAMKKEPAAPKAKDSSSPAPDNSKSPADKAKTELLKQKADALKKIRNQHFNEISKSIKAMGDDLLPRRKTMEKVSVVVPAGKSAGDDVTFSNPHVPGQKLRVKVPKNTVAGGKFVVSVPVPHMDDGVDRNKFARPLQDAFNAYSIAHDEWCGAVSAWKEAIKEKYHLHHERMNKFDDLIQFFPKDLLTPVDGSYMRKIVRRARQAASKRLAKEGAMMPEKVESIAEPEPQAELPDDPDNPKQWTLTIPVRGVSFDQTPLNLLHFAEPEQDAEDLARKEALLIEFSANSFTGASTLSMGASTVEIEDKSSPFKKEKLPIKNEKSRGAKDGKNDPFKTEPVAEMLTFQLPLKGAVFETKRFVVADFTPDEQDNTAIF